MAPLETYEGVVEEEEPPAAEVSCMRDTAQMHRGITT